MKTDELLDEIKALVEQNLARFSWPYDYEFREDLPKTRIGKIAYNVLMQEEEMKNKNKKFTDTKEELLEQVVGEDKTDELIKKVEDR
jgi:acyl-coenzyme A synthetase/AMP-(fatty) acid ligase